jgi:hypothetical protein
LPRPAEARGLAESESIGATSIEIDAHGISHISHPGKGRPVEHPKNWSGRGIREF